MPTTLEKTRKQIAKKRGGDVSALHEKSRNSLRLHKASVRDQRLDKLAAARGKREQPIVDRVAFFHEALQDAGGEPLSMAAVQGLIDKFIHQYDDELGQLKKARRPGRPATAREDLLRIKVAALNTEHEQGFLMPDVLSEEGIKTILRWEGHWAYLTTIPWIKVTVADQSRPADFPSKGIN